MSKENEAALTPEFPDQAAGMHELFTGLISIMNTLQPEGYTEVFPALTFRPIKE